MSASYRLVRLRSVDPHQPGRRNYTILKRPGIPAIIKFEEQKGWHKLPTSIAEVLRDEQDSSGMAVFDVMSHEEAIALERAEEMRASAKAMKAKASNPHAMAFLTSKSAADMAIERPAPVAPSRERAVLKTAEPRATVATEEIDWDNIGASADADPADEIGDESDDAEMEVETIELSTPVAPAPVVEDAPRRASKPPKGNRK